MNRARTAMSNLFTRHLFLTNVISCGGLLGLGDSFIQNMDRYHVQKTKGILKPFDYGRTGRMIVIGLMLGPFNHFWYGMLDKAVKGSGLNVVVKKICADQAVAGPFFCTSFLIGSSVLEGRSLEAAIKEWKEKFLTIYLADWCVWPPAQFINFYFLPSRFRVLYVAMVTLCWNTFLSFMKHRDIHASHDYGLPDLHPGDSVSVYTSNALAQFGTLHEIPENPAPCPRAHLYRNERAPDYDDGSDDSVCEQCAQWGHCKQHER